MIGTGWIQRLERSESFDELRTTELRAAHGDSSMGSELKAVEEPAVRLLERSNH
jgi:hypothetical protein